MTLVAVDYGRKRTGIAAEIHGVILPLEPVIGTRRDIAERLGGLSEGYGGIEVVLGLPLSALGKPTELSIEVEAFAEELRGLGFTVHLERETGSSRAAAALVGRKDRKGRSDSVAACEILKRHLGTI